MITETFKFYKDMSLTDHQYLMCIYMHQHLILFLIIINERDIYIKNSVPSVSHAYIRVIMWFGGTGHYIHD